MSAAADFAERFAAYWHAVDRFVLRDDGLATERVNYFDSAALIRRIALRPRAWPALLRIRR